MSNLIKTLLIFTCTHSLFSCSSSQQEASFNLQSAQTRWNTSDKIWTTDELKSLESGRTVYKKNCAACHAIDGGGNLTIGAPALANNAIVRGDFKMHIELIKKGNNVMPAYQQILQPSEIINVAAFERNAWGNHDYQVFIQN